MCNENDNMKLKHLVEMTAGCEMRTPKDFDFLARCIYNRTGNLLSSTTLKRFWGYIEKEGAKRETRQSTLDTLARFVGYCDWQAFCQEKGDEEGTDTSNLFLEGKVLCASQLRRGDRIQLLWRPDRELTLRYMGDDAFEVVQCRNSKLSVGDTFKCPTLIQGLPLVLTQLVHNQQPPCSYVCGKQGGITFNRIEKEKELKNS